MKKIKIIEYLGLELKNYDFIIKNIKEFKDPVITIEYIVEDLSHLIIVSDKNKKALFYIEDAMSELYKKLLLKLNK